MAETQEKTCRYCGKKVLNLGQHIVNIHPQVLKSIEESGKADITVQQIKESINNPQQRQSLKDMIRDRIEMIMDLKMLESLTKNPDISIQDMQGMTEPANQRTAIEQLRDFKEVADMFSRESQSGSDWTDVAIHSLPIVKDLVRGRHNEDRKRNEVNKRRTKPGIRRIIYEDPGNSGQSGNNSRESGRTSRMSEPTSKSIGQSSSRDKGGGPISRGRNGRN